MKKLLMIMGLAVGLACRGEGTDTQLPADVANWSVVKLVKAGRDAMAAGERDRALSFADAAVARDSGYADAWRLMGMIRLQRGETNAATQAFHTALLIAPGDTASKLELAWLIWNEDQAKALENLNMVMQTDVPDRDELIRRVLALLAETGQETKALQLFKQWQPSFTMGELGVSLFYDGRRSAAHPFLDAAWQAGEERSLVGLYLAAADGAKGRRDRVSICLNAYLEKARDVLPKDEAETFWTAMGGASNDAVMKEVWAQIERRYPSEPDQRMALAKRMEETASVVRRRGDLALACEFYRQICLLDPNSSSWADWVLLEERLSGEAQARQCVTTILSRVTDPMIREGVLAKDAHYRGDLKSAIKGYRASLASKSGSLALRLFLVRALLADGNTGEARQEIEAADAMKGSLTWRDRMDMAEFWFEVGELSHALELNPNLLVEKTKARTVASDWDGAMPLATQAVSNQPGNAEAWRLMGMIQSRLQRYAESRESLEKSLALNNHDGIALQELGWVLWSIKNVEEAKATWEKMMAGDVTNRTRVVRQIVAAMVEEGHKDMALDCHVRWVPDVTPLSTGLELARAGRMKAAQPFLERGWRDGKDLPVAGLYLARVRSVNGIFAGTPGYLMPFIASGLSNAPASDVALVLDSLRVCSGVDGSGEALDATANALANRPDQSEAVTDMYVAYARDEEDRGNLVPAMGFYEKALARDPNRRIWPLAWNLANRINEVSRGTALLSNVLARTTAPAVKSGVEGKLADIRGEYTLASALYRDSLKVEPAQPEIHQDLFEVCLKLGEFGQARHEAEWMESEVRSGNARLQAVLAMMWGDLGEDSKALDIWQFLHLGMPDVSYYGIEMGMAQFRCGKGDEAVETLKEVARKTPTALGFELLVEVLSALGRPGEAVTWSQKGLAMFSSPVLRRTLAENLEAVDGSRMATGTLAAAQASVADDPGSSSMALLQGRSLELAGKAGEAAELHEGFLRRNPDFVPSLVFLRDYEIVAEHPRRALPYADRLVKACPWNDAAVRRYAMTVAEADGFSRAIRILEPLASQDIGSVVATLVYGNTTPWNYPGMNTVSQMVSHVTCLAKNEYTFLKAIPAGPRQEKGVMMILLNPDDAVVEALDPVLKEYNACAILMMDPNCLRHPVPRKPAPERLAELCKSGRWSVGVTLPDVGSAPVRADGVRGNPLTHRIVVGGAVESLDAMTNRVCGLLSAAASALEGNGPRLFYYPGGDYGQKSLDTDRMTLNALSNIVARAFDGAFCGDDNGFISGQRDLCRLPAKSVSSAWNSQALLNHLEQANSVVVARLELAKLFYWHGQSEAAAHWFRKAREAGANPYEITFNQAANAAMAGDLPVALERARAAVKMAPEDDHRPAALLEKAMDMRRPTVEIRGGAWWDNENRQYQTESGEAEGPIRDWLRWTGAVGRHDWETTGLGHERGTSAELGFLAYVAPEVWLKGGMREWFMDTLPDVTGWDARLHLPNPTFHGNVELFSEQEMMETVEALREGITAHREGVETYSRLYDFWDCFADASYTERSDGNNTWWANARIIRRLKETPYLGIGYVGRFADSTGDVPEYWSPQELQQHQAYAAFQATGQRWGCQLSGQAGYAQERGTTWRYVWGGRLAGNYRLFPRLNVGGDVSYQGGPIYNRTTLDAFLNLRW